MASRGQQRLDLSSALQPEEPVCTSPVREEATLHFDNAELPHTQCLSIRPGAYNHAGRKAGRGKGSRKGLPRHRRFTARGSQALNKPSQGVALPPLLSSHSRDPSARSTDSRSEAPTWARACPLPLDLLREAPTRCPSGVPVGRGQGRSKRAYNSSCPLKPPQPAGRGETAGRGCGRLLGEPGCSQGLCDGGVLLCLPRTGCTACGIHE